MTHDDGYADSLAGRVVRGELRPHERDMIAQQIRSTGLSPS